MKPPKTNKNKMKLLLILIAILTSGSIYGQAEKDILRYYSKTVDKADTSYYCKVVKSSKGYSFIFPETVSKYYLLKDSVKMLFDTIIEKRTSVFGSYRFRKKYNKIIFNDSKRGYKFFDLYNLSENEFLAPDLFSSSTDSYNTSTKLLDSNIVIQVSGRSINCFKFLQVMKYHYSEEFRVVYIDKKTLLPSRFEYFSDQELSKMNREIFAEVM